LTLVVTREENYKQQIIGKINQLEEVNDESVLELIESYVYQDMLYNSVEEKEVIIIQLFNQIRRLGALQPLLDDDSITEIMINGHKELYIERKGQMLQVKSEFKSRQELELLIQKIVSKMDRKVNEKHPICDVRLSCGSRVNIVLDPIAIEGPCVTIRKFPSKKLTRDDLILNGTIDEGAMEFLEKLVKKKYNMFISGGTSSGKTTLLNVLSDAISQDERIITIEDSAELRLHTVKNLIRLESRNSTDNLNNKIPIKELIKSSLRMRPDRIIVGEVRGDETIDMLQAMNTGHDGSISTGHSNSIEDMLIRLETMVITGTDIPLLAVRQQIASALDIMVHIQKINSKGRRIIEISEVTRMFDHRIQLNSLYNYDEELDKLLPTGNMLLSQEKLKWN